MSHKSGMTTYWKFTYQEWCLERTGSLQAEKKCSWSAGRQLQSETDEEARMDPGLMLRMRGLLRVHMGPASD